MDEAPRKPPAAAATESTIRMGLMSSTVPSSLRNSPCFATAMAVPMVSKKSDIMSEKANTSRTGVVMTFAMPMTPVSSTWKGAPKVLKSRPDTMPAGAAVTPRGMPARTATMMPRSSAPLIWRHWKTTVATIETRPTMNRGFEMSPKLTRVDSLATMMPALAMPIMAMKMPRPTEIA